jgi:Ca-activated chloride channel family protein
MRRISPPARTAAPPSSHRASVVVGIDAGVPLAAADSPSHTLISSYDGRRHRLTTGAAQVPMDRDLVVNWQVLVDQKPRVTAFSETVGGDRFLQLMFVPPGAAQMLQTNPRELIFVIDTSGSMGGHSIARARTALQSAISQLPPSDRFNVIEFNSDARVLFPAPVAVAAGPVEAARRFVSRLRADGGTNMAAAIEAALTQPATAGFLRQIVFMTDGSVGNEAELFARIKQGLGAARLFTVGIGRAPNTHFMRKAAQFGRGSYVQITDAEDVVSSMQQLFTKLEHVALSDIEIEWPAGFDVYPERIPDLYHGEPVVVAARSSRPLTGPLSLEVSGRIGSYGWSDRVSIAPGDAAGVASVWARRRVESLMDQRLEGETEDNIRAAVVDVALAHGILTSYTSLVAVDRTPEQTRNALLRREALGNLLPAGSDPGARYAVLPATATDSRWYRLVGTALAILLLTLTAVPWRPRGTAA